MSMMLRIKMFFTMRYIRKAAKAKGGEFDELLTAVETAYAYGKNKKATPEETAEYAAAVQKIAQIAGKH